MGKKEIMFDTAQRAGMRIMEFTGSELLDSDFVGIPYSNDLDSVLSRLNDLRDEAVKQSDVGLSRFWSDTALFLRSVA